MTTSSIRPDGVLGTGPNISVIGAGSANAALADESDSSFVQIANETYRLTVSMSSFTLPAGAVMVSVVNNFRGRTDRVTGFLVGATVTRQYQSGGTQWFNMDSSAATYTNANYGPTMPTTQAAIDGYIVEIIPNGVGLTAGEIAILRLSVDFTYAMPPTVAVTGPTGTIGTTSPTVTWTHTPGSDAQTGQTKYQMKVFSQAQYAAGGFDPATSTATYDSGVVASSALSAVSGPLPTSTPTYRAYVRTAQTSTGTDQYSPWAFSQFVLDVAPATISGVVATATNATGAISVVATRTTAGPAWEQVGVQVTYDGGVTWVPVRGGTQTPITNANTFTIIDYEAPNGTLTQYRARATRTVFGLAITSDWVVSNVVAWTQDSPCAIWLKDPSHPGRNMHLDAQLPDVLRDRVQGVFRPIGARYPVVISDVLQAGTSTITIVTRSDAEATKLLSVAAGGVLLLQTPSGAGWQWGSRYVAPGALQEAHTSPGHLSSNRVWTLNLVEVARPPDDGVEAGAPTGFAILLMDTGAPNGFTFGTSEISGHTTHWEFGDGATDACPAMETVEHTYAQPGTYEVAATCHGWTETVVLDTDDPVLATPTLDSIDPADVPSGGPVTLTLHGADFAEPMLVRLWDVSTYMGDWPGTVIDANTATVAIDTTDWPAGTGGIDVVLTDPGLFSNQLQFQVVAP